MNGFVRYFGTTRPFLWGSAESRVCITKLNSWRVPPHMLLCEGMFPREEEIGELKWRSFSSLEA